MKEKLKILIANDDGIRSEGIAKLARAAASFGTVWVAAPEHQCSGMSVRLTISEKSQMAVYRYEGLPRDSLLRFKFGGRQSYAAAYGRLLAARIQGELRAEFDLLTYVPVSPRRRWSRGYDQVRLLAEAVGRELGQKPVRALKKIRHNPAQSSLREREQRRANVLGAYRAVCPEALAGQRILLLDDIITTGATVSECARVLQTAGAAQVLCAAVAARGDGPK